MAVQREKLVRNAEKLVSRGKVEAAIREYRKLLAEQPKDTNTLNRVGDLYARIHRIDEAVRLFTQIAGQYTDEGFFVKAIAIYKKIIKLDPTRLSVYERLADLYHRQGLVNEARTQYQVLADYYVNQENSASASSIYQRMVELEPEDPSHRAKLAELYHQQQLLDKAMEQYRSIADIMLSHDQVQQAEQVFLRALDVSAQDLGFIENAAARLRKAGALDAARRVVEAAAQRNPAARRLLEAEEETPAAAQSPVPEQVLDSADEILGDDAELIQALREADQAVGEVSPPSSSSSSSDDLVMDWSEEESESLVRPPADVLNRQEPGFGFDGDGEQASVSPGGEQQTFELDLGELEDLAASRDEAAALDIDADFDLGGDLAEGLESDDLGLEQDLDLDIEAPEPTATKPVAGAINEDYLSEAEVLAKYGLREKALERVQQVLATHPEHAGAHRILVQLYLENDEKDSARQVAERLGSHPGAQESEDWSQVVEMLADADVTFHPPPAVAGTDDLDFLESSPAASASLAQEIAEPESAEAGGFQDLDFSDLEAPTEDVAIEEPAAEEAAATQEQELFLDDLEAPALEQPSFEDLELEESVPEGPVPEATEAPVAEPTGFSLGLGDLDDFEDDEWGDQPAEAALEPTIEAPDLTSDWAADAAFGDLTPESAEEDAADLIDEAPELGEIDFDEPAFDGASFEQPAFDEPVAEELSLDEEEPAEKPAAASPAASSKPLSADSSKRINQLLESLLDDVPAPRKKKRQTSQDSEVERILGMAAKKPAIPPPPETRSREAPSLETPSLETLVPEAEPAEAEMPEPAATEAQPGTMEAPPADAEPEEAVAASAARDLKSGTRDEGPVEVQIGLPKSQDDDELEDHSDIEDALSFMEPVSGSLPPPVSGIVAEDIVDLDDSGTSWLDEVSARREAQPESDEQLFDEEESFFDLGAELEEELSVSDAVGTEPPEEQSLEEIVEGFKQGVAEALSAEDYDTHFDLGIAYREMGLLDEAIGEFQTAAKSPAHLVQCCSMLGICFLEKGLPELAVKWYTQGLKTPDISEQDTLALLYDLGEVYLTTGDTANAHKAFVEVYGINTNFRDIASRVAETRPA